MARITAEFLNTDNVEVTLTITMTMGQWKRLREDIDKNSGFYPSGNLRSAINDAVTTLEKQVSTKVPE